MPSVNVLIRKGGKVLDQVERPLHNTLHGPAVRYRKRLWPLIGNAIDLDGPDLEDAPTASALHILEPLDDGPDRGQEHVIGLPRSARVLVDAGPGTGKTHVACARIAHLISQGVEPGRIWVISFTRTAIAEFRSRIAMSLGDEDAAASLQIRTLDAHAWVIQSGFSPEAKITGSYADNIRNASEMIRTDEDAADYLSRIEHLVIDEGQDILGDRADWCIALIDEIDPDCGVTVFADEAQSIYDFTEEADKAAAGHSLPEALRLRGFDGASLSRVHRTSCPRLKKIFTAVRQRVLLRGRGLNERCLKIREDILSLAHENSGSIRDLQLKGLPDNTLILVRRRVDVLQRSAWAADVPHRLRMSGLPARILPWIAALFWDFAEARLSRKEFDSRWKARVAGAAAAGGPDATHAWKLLFEAAGDEGNRIEIRRLRTILGRESPPVLFCSPDFGDEGPIIGTVHASKGREAEIVRLYLSPLCEHDAGLEEETRVSFVGATRARVRLIIGEGGSSRAASSDSGRVWRFSKERIQVEIGRQGDLGALGLVGKAVFATSDETKAAQLSWLETPCRTGLSARQRKEIGWNYELCGNNGGRLGVLSQSFTDDIREIAGAAKKFPPASFFPHMRSIGLRTIVLAPDDPDLQLLHEPWSNSGFLFAPMLTGFSAGRFGKQ